MTENMKSHPPQITVSEREREREREDTMMELLKPTMEEFNGDDADSSNQSRRQLQAERGYSGDKNPS